MSSAGAPRWQSLLAIFAGLAMCCLLWPASEASEYGPRHAMSWRRQRRHGRQQRLQQAYPRGVHAPSKMCSWARLQPQMRPETNTSEAAVLGSFLKFLHDEVFTGLGYLYALRDGNLLGAVRHGGLIPGDSDLDAVILLPLEDEDGAGISSALDVLRGAVQARLDAIGRPFRLEVNDDGKSRWLVFLQHDSGRANTPPLHADVIVYPSSLFAKPLRGHDGHKVYATKVQRAFSSLCLCPHWPLDASVCWESAPAYLRGLYGDYTKLTKQHGLGAGTLEEVYV